MSPLKNVHEAVRNCKVHLVANFSGRFRQPKRADDTSKMGYDPELYVRCSIILQDYHWHPMMDDHAWKDQHND